MKKVIIILLALLLVLVGCSTTTTAETNDPCLSEDGVYEVTFVTDTGGINDESFNQGTWEGIEKYCVDNTSVDATYIEATDSAQLESNLNIAAEQSEVVVASGFNFASPVGNVAPKHPDTNFVLIDSEPVDNSGEVMELSNVMSYYFAEEQAGYIVGYIAGKMTNTNHIGFIGGQAIPTVSRFAYGYIQGAQMANPNIIIDIQYADSFTDQTKGQTMATAMYGTGVDIIFSTAGGVTTGVINEAITRQKQGEDVWVIGVDVDQYNQGIYTDADGNEKSVILTSALKNVGNAAYAGLEAHFNNTFTGMTTTLTYTEDAVGVPVENPNVEQGIIDQANASLETNIATVPHTLEEAEAIITTATIQGELK